MRPPQHRITPSLKIADLGDPAWDSDRYNAEIGPLEGDDLKAHPIWIYRQGETHFDLDAPGTVFDNKGQPHEVAPRDYLLKEPRFFYARRLSATDELPMCLDRGDHGGSLLAFRIAVKSVDGFKFEQPNHKHLSDAQIQEIADELGADAVYRIGVAIVKASRAPTPSEGKRSGSSRGLKSPAPGVSPAAGARGTASATAGDPTENGTTASELDEGAPA